ncbi:hypothetical protein ACVRWE_06675 [Streptococcus urinalis]|uniref:Transcriptional regulator n=1 Tax=Streptococcus urinalis 2285-97 TaxID=764291 RepID=G5KHF1_9STRE|nr:hypothetical protein [Streptococcus urinalis]EHJ56455.1 hypothetical protein STRUR_1465 [Streptococcus urinalis 2285-97]
MNVYFYLAPQLIGQFSKKYPQLSFTKRGLQCYYNQELPRDILIEMLQWQGKKVEENET